MDINVLKFKINPANPLDAMLCTLFRRRDADGLDDLIEGTAVDAFRAAVTLAASPAVFFDVVQFLSSNGLMASALAAIENALPTLPDDPALFAGFIDLRATIKERAGMNWSAKADRRFGGRLRNEVNRHDELPVVEHERFFIIDAWNQPDRFAAISTQHMATALADDPLRDPFLTKRIHHSGSKIEHMGSTVDFSFFVLDQDETPVLQVECDTYFPMQPLRCRESPIIMAPLTTAVDTVQAAVPFAMNQLLMTSSWAGLRGVSLELDLRTEAARVLPPLLNRLEPIIEKVSRGTVSLGRSVDDIFASYSENHRRSIRKGSNYLDIRHFTSDGIAAWDHYLAIHAKINRTPALARSLFFDVLESGQCVLYGAFLDMDPVGLTLISHHGNTAYYSAGITAGPAKIPVGHTLMHRAIADAREDGFSRFDFGLLDTGANSATKMQSIARFKIGFCDDVSERLVALVAV